MILKSLALAINLAKKINTKTNKTNNKQPGKRKEQSHLSPIRGI